MFCTRNPVKFLPEFAPSAQIRWAEKIAEIPEIRDNVRVVNQSNWLIYEEEEGVWKEYSPRHAKLCRYLSRAVMNYFNPLCTFLEYKSSFDAVSETRRKSLKKLMSKFLGHDFLEKILDALQGDDEICINEFNDLFNKNPYVLPCANGLLDFRTLQLRPLQREDYFTYKAAATWDAGADTTDAANFIRGLFPVNTEEMLQFVTEWFGYCLTGITVMQVLVFFIGYGSNGKSKLTSVMENILGRQGFAHVTYEALCQRSTGPNEEVYAARHARLWQIDENDGDHTLNMAMIKRITGEDTIMCRQLYGHAVKYVFFSPVFFVFL
jgi:phage/plasmid-associated DNA primase